MTSLRTHRWKLDINSFILTSDKMIPLLKDFHETYKIMRKLTLKIFKFYSDLVCLIQLRKGIWIIHQKYSKNDRVNGICAFDLKGSLPFNRVFQCLVRSSLFKSSLLLLPPLKWRLSGY